MFHLKSLTSVQKSGLKLLFSFKRDARLVEAAYVILSTHRCHLHIAAPFVTRIEVSRVTAAIAHRCAEAKV